MPRFNLTQTISLLALGSSVGCPNPLPMADANGSSGVTTQSESTTEPSMTSTSTTTTSNLDSEATATGGMPVAQGDDYVFRQFEVPELIMPGLFENDSNPDGSTPELESPMLVVSDRGWDVEIASDGTFTYGVPASWWGEDRFDYTLADGTTSAEVRLLTTPVRIDLNDVAANGGHGGVVFETPPYDVSAIDQFERGWTVGTAGDIDADGRSDIVLGNQYTVAMGQPRGHAFVLFGSNEEGTFLPADYQASFGGFTVEGAQPSTGHFGIGSAVLGGRDYNGDAVADIVIGNNYWNSNSGGVMVVYGTTMQTTISYDSLDGIEGYAIDGIPGEDIAMGAALSHRGDYDSDGIEDVLIASPAYNAIGRVYMLQGGSVTVDIALDAPDMLVDGFGRSIAGGSDFNGDGIADFAISAPGADLDGSASGAVFVFDGSAENPTATGVQKGVGGYFLVGGFVNRLGSAIADVGDLDGDGIHELAIGQPNADAIAATDTAAWTNPHEPGLVHVIRGGDWSKPPTLMDIQMGIGGFTISADTMYEDVGVAIAGGVDVNADGLSDIIIGSRRYGDGPNADDRTGRVYVIFGKRDDAAVSLADIAAGMGGYVIDGESPLDGVGRSVAGAGDFNGDGVDDILIGSTVPHLEALGRVYLVHGVRSGLEEK